MWLWSPSLRLGSFARAGRQEYLIFHSVTNFENKCGDFPLNDFRLEPDDRDAGGVGFRNHLLPIEHEGSSGVDGQRGSARFLKYRDGIEANHGDIELEMVPSVRNLD
jgi:hypothetical protein